jgi:putative transposase
MLKGVKLKLKLKPDQIPFFAQNAGACRWIYNNALAAKIKYYEKTGGSLSYNTLQNMLPAIKKHPNIAWLKQCESTSLQISLRNLDQAFQNFFNSLNGTRAGRPVGFPKFKKKGKCKDSFTITNTNHRIQVKANGYLKIPKVGLVKVWNGVKRFKLINGLIKQATFSKDSDGCWYVSLTVDTSMFNSNPPPKYASTGETDGMDLGIKTTATFKICSINLPESIKKLEKKIKKLNRVLAKKKLGGKNWEKARAKLSKCHYTIAQIRKNFMHQVSHQVAKQVDILTVETLDIQQMMQNPNFARTIGRQGWYILLTFLKYKLEDSGKVFIQVDKWFPSTKLCSTCSYINPTITISTRSYICPKCGSNHDRDQNAAKNLDTISRWYKLTGEEVTSKVNYIKSISPNLGTF